MTPEERFSAAVQAAFTEYRNQTEKDCDVDSRRFRRVRDSIGRMIGEVSEVNWLVINGEGG